MKRALPLALSLFIALPAACADDPAPAAAEGAAGETQGLPGGAGGSPVAGGGAAGAPPAGAAGASAGTAGAPAAAGAAGAPAAFVPPTDAASVNAFLQSRAYREWAGESKDHESAGPHGGTVRTYVSPELAASLAAKNPSHPAGVAAVKELYQNGKPAGFAYSAKLADDSAGGANWFWYEVFTDAPAATAPFAGKDIALCKNCHTGGSDFVLIPFPLQLDWAHGAHGTNAGSTQSPRTIPALQNVGSGFTDPRSRLPRRSLRLRCGSRHRHRHPHRRRRRHAASRKAPAAPASATRPPEARPRRRGRLPVLSALRRRGWAICPRSRLVAARADEQAD